MNALAHSYFFWIFLTSGLLGLYILPSVIAAIRGVEGLPGREPLTPPAPSPHGTQAYPHAVYGPEQFP